MSFEWSDTPPETALHPRLDPVAAWLFERNSSFLRTGDPTSDAAWLYSMAIDASGFNPEQGQSWRALAVPNPDAPGQASAAFSLVELQDEIRAQLDAVPDARVDVVPIRDGGLLPPEDLLRRANIGSLNGIRRPRCPLPTPRAIIGIIDHGINVFHHRFRRAPDSTRVAYFWDQSAMKGDDKLPLGREWQLADIERALQDARGDEDVLLRQIGGNIGTPGFHPLGFRASHGTHVLDLAAGFEPDDETGHEFPIIAVNMPAEVTRETSGSMLSLPFCLGLSYIADRARWLFYQFQSVCPVYVNFSFGLTGGPRDGLHRLERTMSNVAALHRRKVREQPGFETAEAPFTVVTAAGNNNLSQGHARSRAGASLLDVLWQIQPVDPTPNVVEIRLAYSPSTPEATVIPIELSLRPPGDASPASVTFEVPVDADPARLFWLRRQGSTIGQLSAVGVQGHFLCLTLALAATDPGPNGSPAALAGTWGLTVRSDAIAPDRIDAWILRDDVPGGFRDTGRQSYFLDPEFARFAPTGRRVTEDDDGDAVIRRAGSLNALATGSRPPADPRTAEDTLLWVVGAVQQVSALPNAPLDGATAYSAAPLDGTGERIDLSALGDVSAATPGVLAAGTRSGTRLALSGTSVAAPQVVRFFATGQGVLEDADEPTSQRLGPTLRSSANPR